MMFKKKGGSRGNLRKKQVDNESDEEASASNASNGPSSLQHVDSCPSNLLSFGEDLDNADEFKIKKSSRSRRMEKFRKQIEKDRNGEEGEGEEADPDPVHVPVPVQTAPFNGNLKKEKILDDDCAVVDVKGSSPKTDPFKTALKGGQIPDAQVVFLARKQRARAREEGDVIPISKPEDDTQRYKRGMKSRLVREDDENDQSDEEDHGKFYSKRENLKEMEEERKMLQEQFLQVEQGDSEQEEDEDFDKWEMEQIKKAVSGQTMSTIQRDYERGSGFVSEWNLRPEVREAEPMELDVQIIDDDLQRLNKRKKNKNLPKYGGGSMEGDKTMSLTDHLNKMKLQLTENEQVNGSKKLEIEKLRNHLEENNENVKQLQSTIPLCSKQYALFQELKMYCRDLLECLNEKVPEIDRIDGEMLNLLKDRATFLQKRHRQDIKDEFEGCSVSVDRKALLASDAAKGMRTADREARRTRRRQGREKTKLPSVHRDGDSSDDELVPSQIQAFNSDHAKLCAEAEAVMNDASEEFSSVKSVVSRFYRWFTEDRGSFEEAYINICVQKLIAPLVRLEMIGWNPLQDNCKSVESYAWFQDLLFLLPSEHEELPENVQPIVDLIPLVVEKVVVPKLTVLIENVWDPTSSRQSNCLKSLLSDLMCYPTICSTSKQVQSLLHALQAKAKESLEEDLFMPIYSKETIMTQSTGAKAFVYRQFWFALMVLRNINGLDGFLSSDIVQELAMDGIVNRQLVLGLQCADQSDPSVSAMAKAIVNVLPSTWYKQNERTLKKQFEPLCKVLCSIGEETYFARSESSRDVSKDVYKMLTKLRAHEYAAKYRDKINLKI